MNTDLSNNDKKISPKIGFEKDLKPKLTNKTDSKASRFLIDSKRVEFLRDVRSKLGAESSNSDHETPFFHLDHTGKQTGLTLTKKQKL